jgi:dienelactone hydrolase
MGMRWLTAILLLSLAGCAAPRHAVSQRVDQAQLLAAASGWEAMPLRVPGFDFMSYFPQAPRSGKALTVYIEGDGLGWLTLVRPSKNPTPLNPVGLKMALAHPDGKAAYLGRPCQYVAANALGCETRYWTEERFSPEVVSAMSKAVDQLKTRAQVSHINIVGYSGGGAIAVLLATQRADVVRIVTVAGNLDTQAWTQWHGLGELTGSINPADLVMRVTHIPQWHFVGGKDNNITPALVQGYASRFPAASPVHVWMEDDFSHGCCWAERWTDLWGTHIR